MVNSKGVPFFVEFGANKVASIDPSTMIIREWTLPNAASRPRRLAIDAQDNVWYSDYARGFLGKLDPATSQVKEWASPGGPKSQPYGIAVIDGKIWYSESGVQPNTIVMFDPATEKFQTWPIPSGGGVVRNVSVTKDGNLALALSGVNKIGLVEIRSERRASSLSLLVLLELRHARSRQEKPVRAPKPGKRSLQGPSGLVHDSWDPAGTPPQRERGCADRSRSF